MQTDQINFQNRANGEPIEFTGEPQPGQPSVGEVTVGSTVTLRSDSMTIVAEVLDGLPDGTVIGRICGVEGQAGGTSIGDDVTFRPENIFSCHFAA
jgi:hypothetical protein